MTIFLLTLLLLCCHNLAAQSIRVAGSGFEIGVLENGGKAFMNRTYTWEGVPEQISGWQYTRVNGGVGATLTATPDADGQLYIACAPTVPQLPGWRLLPEWRFNYTDKNRTVIRTFAKPCTAGTPVPIPTGSWTGCMVLASKLSGAPTAPEPDLARVPGVVIDHSPASSRNYIGCPSIAVLPNRDYVASHSFFGGGNRRGHTWVFRSTDNGTSWQRSADLDRQHFSSLFVHRGSLYLMGTGGNGGQVIIRRSDDAGQTWTEPQDAKTGVLLAESGYHSAPVPVVVHQGRIWRAMEDSKAGRGWPRHFRAFMLSAPEDADLLDASSWTCSNRVASSDQWLDREFEGWLEGNAVVTPDGHIVNILRAHTYVGGKAAVIRVAADGKTSSFDPATGFIDLPGGAKKFTIRFDPVSKRYWTLANPVDEGTRQGRGAASVRNTLSLLASGDLRHWTIERRVLVHADPVNHGFQYVDWQFDGEDIVAVSRTAHDDGIGGAHNFHDANCFTFHRVESFRGQ